MNELPKKYNHNDSEQKWQDAWETQGVYLWDSNATRENTFSIDTPPPTVSGSLHIGHVFSYTQTDIVARYQRMIGKSIFYPMGWDDNGLPTERRVQNVYSITCNPALPYKADWVPEERTLKRQDFEAVSRRNFIEACSILTKKDEEAFETVWRKLGLSIDWNLQYATINDHCRRMSQSSFLDLVKKGYAYHVESPTMWDVDFQSAVAQAELEDRECTGAYHDVSFQVDDGSSFVISTTRPELLPACIAVVAHPDDERYKSFFGKYAITPLFHSKVPILPATHADPEKGTGILMVCTFGDIHDVEWWKSSKLPLKQIIGRNGRLKEISFGEEPFNSEKPEAAQSVYSQLVGLTIRKAQPVIVTLLTESGALISEPKPITHPVKFYEKGDSPIEFITTRQWFIRILDSKKTLLEQGEKINWLPGYMKSRYENWVNGLNQDWCISRQRFFGVPFPVWYPVTAEGDLDYSSPMHASAEQLPVDPTVDCPAGYTEEQRNQPLGFTADPDVMDTWATSSLTPQIMSNWGLDEKRHASVFPFDIRPQSHEIIRTWAFYTITKAWMHEGQIPWKNVTISGWVLDPDRKKMSKSKGNVVTPEGLLESYSSDAVRYWSAKARLGSDTAFEESMFTIGKKLVTKVFNASKFVVMQLAEHEKPLSPSLITEPMDCSFLAYLNMIIEKATTSFNQFDYASALEQTETAFWLLCDHYIEIVKGRAYREENEVKKLSALAGLDAALKTFLKLLAPHIPFITEEIWSWRYSDESASIHNSSWPKPFETTTSADSSILIAVIDVLSDVRGAKSKANTNMKHVVTSLTVNASKDLIDAVKQGEEDLIRAGSIQSITYTESSEFSVVVELE